MILAYKLGMMSIIDSEGAVQAVTVLHLEPNVITQIKTNDKDGYQAVQVSTGVSTKLSKPQKGHLRKQGIKQDLKTSREYKLTKLEELDFKLGQQLDVNFFEVGDKVQVSGLSKGKGFAGTIKRHNFSRSPKSHGHKGHIREPGSIGALGPLRVLKGKKMPGRMGNKKVTIKGLRVSLVDDKRQLLGISGAVPGPRKGLLIIKKA